MNDPITRLARASRRGFLIWLGGLGAATAGVFFATRSEAAPYPPLRIPAGMVGDMRTRLGNLHARYSGIRASSGVTGVRRALVSDIGLLHFSDEWLAAIVRWIHAAGYADAADLMIDAAEVGGKAVRVSAATYLAESPSPLLMANGYAPRIIALHQQETEALAAENWKDLRRQLGI
jgi:hypothetical protein